MDQGDILLRDKFIMVLKEVPISQELLQQVRKTPPLTFDEVKMETLALEEEQAEQWMPSDCFAVKKPSFDASKSLTEWKKELCSEILNEVKEKITVMTKTILAELRDSHRPTLTGSRHHVASGPNRTQLTKGHTK